MGTLLRPPPNDDALSSMENALELRHLNDIDPDLFTNLRPLWHPPGARGIYGGAVIAQCLSAAQRTVPDDFLVHSMHCYFVLAGDPNTPVIYHVEHVREGRSFATRTVQARQRGKPIFTTTLSFMRENSAGARKISHDSPLPSVPQPTEDESDGMWARSGPFESQHFETVPGPPDEVKTRTWMRTRGVISESGRHQAHLNALAYMSDSFFIGTVARAHNTFRRPPKGTGDQEDEMRKRIAQLNNGHMENTQNRPEVSMMVSLDHTIYFHAPLDFRSDQWLLAEMQTPWSGEGRGVVQQKIWTRDGKMVATCFQEVCLEIIIVC